MMATYQFALDQRQLGYLTLALRLTGGPSGAMERKRLSELVADLNKAGRYPANLSCSYEELVALRNGIIHTANRQEISDGETAILVEAATAMRIMSWVSPHLPKIELPKEELVLDPAPDLDP